MKIKIVKNNSNKNNTVLQESTYQNSEMLDILKYSFMNNIPIKLYVPDKNRDEMFNINKFYITIENNDVSAVIDVNEVDL